MNRHCGCSLASRAMTTGILQVLPTPNDRIPTSPEVLSKLSHNLLFLYPIAKQSHHLLRDKLVGELLLSIGSKLTV